MQFGRTRLSLESLGRAAQAPLVLLLNRSVPPLQPGIMSAYFEAPPELSHHDPAAVVTSCIESGAHQLLLDEGALPPAFFDVSTGVAGDLVQRLTLYGIRMAAVVPDPALHSRSFQEFAHEANQGTQFRFFRTRDQAAEWLESMEGR